MTLNTFTAGVNTSFSSQLNDNFNSSSILTIDTTTDLDSNSYINVTTPVNDSKNKTYTYTASQLKKADYLIIEMIGKHYSYSSSGGTQGGFANQYVKMETTAPDAVTLLDKLVVSADSSNDDDQNKDSTYFFKYVHTLTANEKSSGISLKITTYGTVEYQGNTTPNASYTNLQIIIKLGY